MYSPNFVGAYINTDTFLGIDSNVSTILSQDFWNTQLWNAILSTTLVRSWSTAPINYVRFKTDNQWQNYIGSQYQNQLWEVIFMNAQGSYKYALTWSGWYAIANSLHDATYIKTTFFSDTEIHWFEVWYSTTTKITKTNCYNNLFSCNFYQIYPGTFECQSSKNPSWIPQGNCQVLNNICRPVNTGTWAVAYLDWYIVPWATFVPTVDWSGTVNGISYEWEDIFQCTIRDWLSAIGDIIGCPITVISKIWSKFTVLIKTLINLFSWVSSIWSPRSTENIFWFILPNVYAEDLWTSLDSPFYHEIQQVPTWLYDIRGNPIYKYDITWIRADVANSYTWKDIAWINKAMFQAGDNVKNMDRGGIKGLMAWTQWYFLVVMVCSCVVYIIIVFVR